MPYLFVVTLLKFLKRKILTLYKTDEKSYIDLLVYSNFLLSVLSHNMYSKQSYVLCSLVGAVVYGSGHSAGGCCQFISDAEVGIMFKIIIVELTLKLKKNHKVVFRPLP